MRKPLWCAILTCALAASGCVDDTVNGETTPRARTGASSSDDDPGRGGSARAGKGAAGADAGAGVPGLDMRSGGGGAVAPTGGVATSGAPRTYRNPRTLAPPWMGGQSAKVVIEEFTDFECPFCRVGAQTMKRVVAHYGSRVKLVFRHLPLSSIHPQARMAAEAAVCAQAQGRFWRMQETLFKNNRALTRADLLKYARRLGLDVPKFTRDLDAGAGRPRVDGDIATARKHKVGGTPAFIINGTKHEGALSFKRFRQLIDAELSP